MLINPWQDKKKHVLIIRSKPLLMFKLIPKTISPKKKTKKQLYGYMAPLEVYYVTAESNRFFFCTLAPEAIGP